MKDDSSMFFHCYFALVIAIFPLVEGKHTGKFNKSPISIISPNCFHHNRVENVNEISSSDANL
jgi:hypothetical protein